MPEVEILSAPFRCTMSKLSELSGLARPTLVRYKKLYLDRIPHEVVGKRVLFTTGAIEAVQNLRAENFKKRGAKKQEIVQSPPNGEA